MTPDSIKALILPELRTMLGHQRRRRLRFRMPLSVTAETILDTKKAGVDLVSMRGAWRVGSVPLARRARGGRLSAPTVECGAAVLMVDTEQHAVDLAGLLNWCGVTEVDVSPKAS